MTRPEIGDWVDYWVTYLEMTAPPQGPVPQLPMGQTIALIGAQNPPVAYFLYLYGQVGGPWEWTDWFSATPEQQAAFVGDPQVRLTTLLVDGWPGGFYMLDSRQPGICDLAYFGLVPQAIGRGLGTWLLATAIRAAWAQPGVGRVTVNTCTLDHPRALALYQRQGFAPVRREPARRQITQAWGMGGVTG